MAGLEVDIFRLADDFLKGKDTPHEWIFESENSPREKPKVLVVDDQTLIVDTMKEILEQAGFETFTAYNGQTALALASKVHPDCLLTDVLMPIMNGVDLAIAMTKMFPSIKVLLFSGQAGISDILFEAKQSGYSFNLITKPVHPEKLIEVLIKMNESTSSSD